MSILDAVEDVKSRSGTPDEVPTVPTSSNPEENVCPICHEEFDQFYKQDFTDLAAAEGKKKQLSDKSAGTELSNHYWMQFLFNMIITLIFFIKRCDPMKHPRKKMMKVDDGI